MTIKHFLLTVVVTLFAGAACARTAPGQGDAQPRVQGDTIQVLSRAMGREIKNVVIVPSQYYDDDMANTRFPTLYLLHGAFGCYSDWSHKANLDELSSRYGVIIVCPDGQDSWYVDSPIDPKMQFETYVSKELVAHIDSTYRTIADNRLRAITGLSMGGHGSLLLAWKHPDVFWSCGSMSGCMNLTKFPDKWHIRERLGDYTGNEKRWRDNSVCNLVDRLKSSSIYPPQNIIIDDGLNDIFYHQNVAMHELLVENGIEHDFIVRPGAHTWDYWVNALDYHLLFFSKAFAQGARLMQKDEIVLHQSASIKNH